MLEAFDAFSNCFCELRQAEDVRVKLFLKALVDVILSISLDLKNYLESLVSQFFFLLCLWLAHPD